MRRYETIFISRPSATEDEIAALITRTEDTVKKHGGNLVKIERWGVRKLAYPIKKELNGNYVYLEYGSGANAVAEAERFLKFDDRILKYLTIKLDGAFIPGDEPVKIEVRDLDSEQEESKFPTKSAHSPELIADADDVDDTDDDEEDE